MTLLLILFTFLFIPLALQYERGGWWRLVAPITLAALIIDVLANYTVLALLTWDWPARGEWTFSTRCVRLQYYPTFGGRVARWTKAYCNFFRPGHI